MTCPRNYVVREGEIGIYHTWSRCVQSAFLCGYDQRTGRDYSYRRDWIQQLLQYQAGCFAIDLGNYNILDNHEHLIVRSRPDIASRWSDEQVAWRWKMAWPEWKDGQWIREPTDQEIMELLLDPAKIDWIRRSLSSVSWFMARVKEPIARQANAETKTKGHFFEGRFGCRELVDAEGLLVCSIYVDLNQIRAGSATSLETSHYSAIQDRIRAYAQREAQASLAEFRAEENSEQYSLEARVIEQLLADCFLSPITPDAPLLLVPERPVLLPATVGKIVPAAPADQPAGKPADPDEPQPATSQPAAAVPQSTSQQARSAKPPVTREIHRRLLPTRRCRASDQCFLPMPFEQYRTIVDWAVQRHLQGTNVPPPDALTSRGADAERYWHAIEAFDSRFRTAVGHPDHLVSVLARRGQKWLHGIRSCAAAFTRGDPGAQAADR